MTADQISPLVAGWQFLGVTAEQLWLSYFSMGGHRMPSDLADLESGAWTPGRHDHDRLAHALNEFYVDRGLNHPVPYWEDLAPPP